MPRSLLLSLPQYVMFLFRKSGIVVGLDLTRQEFREEIERWRQVGRLLKRRVRVTKKGRYELKGGHELLKRRVRVTEKEGIRVSK